jgi:hypothetical protein
MTVDTPVVVAIAGEDRAHFDVVSALMDRMVEHHRPWTFGNVESLRTWLACDGRPWFALKDAVKRAQRSGLRFHGHFGDAAGLPESRMARAQLALLKQRRDGGEKLDTVVLARDLDGRPDRLAGLRQAAEQPWPFAVLIAWCQPEAEAWNVCAFEPRDEAERARHSALKQDLSRCPIQDAHRLTSTASDSNRDAKRVVAALTAGDHDRRIACLAAPFDHLCARGRHTGLTDFLEQIELKFIPLWI